MDKMREEFERWMLANYAADIPPREGDGYADTFMEFAWLAWQHLYPMVADITQSLEELCHHIECSCVADEFDLTHEKQVISTAKARLEGKDE